MDGRCCWNKIQAWHSPPVIPILSVHKPTPPTSPPFLSSRFFCEATDCIVLCLKWGVIARGRPLAVYVRPIFLTPQSLHTPIRLSASVQLGNMLSAAFALYICVL